MEQSQLLPDQTAAEQSADPRSAYIHVPFCKHRCGYCDFTLVAGRDDLVDRYLTALAQDLRQLGRSYSVDTLYFGGGTPTHLAAGQLARLFGIVREWFISLPQAEVCVEANPFGLDADKVAVLAERGVNRVSLGVQSFDSNVLSILERDHDRDDVIAAVELLRPKIANIGFDLIFGVPGQSIGLWQDTLDEAVALQPKHISTYGLTFERGTSFYARLQKGALARCEDEQERAMYALAIDRLPADGYEQYELSNFAQSGFRSRHNEMYWRRLPFFGFGPGAARLLDGRRETNHRSVTTWIQRIEAGRSPIAESEELVGAERAREMIMLGLRRRSGIDLSEFESHAGASLLEIGGGELTQLMKNGLLEQCGNSIRLTREGLFLADTVISQLL